MTDRDWFSGFRQRYSQTSSLLVTSPLHKQGVTWGDTCDDIQNANKNAPHASERVGVAACDGVVPRRPVSHLSHPGWNFSPTEIKRQNQSSNTRHTCHTLSDDFADDDDCKHAADLSMQHLSRISCDGFK